MYEKNFKTIAEQTIQTVMGKDNSISRRTALKMMGTFVAGASISSLGLATTISCASHHKRLVFYFTATGNSLYVARALSQTPISIPQALKEGNLEYEADEIGFVFPDYAAAAPMIVREFVEKVKLNAPYIFSVITFGNFAANVADWWDDFCKQKGVKNSYINTLLMVDNYLPVFDMNEQVRIDKKIPENLSSIVADIDGHMHAVSHFDADDQMKEWLKRLQGEHFPMTAERLLAIDESACIGCGICSTVCPHGNFKINDKASFSGSCEYCLACVHSCPQKALTLARGERNAQARFRNENVSLADIKSANNQLD